MRPVRCSQKKVPVPASSRPSPTRTPSLPAGPRGALIRITVAPAAAMLVSASDSVSRLMARDEVISAGGMPWGARDPRTTSPPRVAVGVA